MHQCIMLMLLQGCPVYMTTSAVPRFTILHEGSMKGQGTQPTVEFFKENKPAWIAEVTSMAKL